MYVYMYVYMYLPMCGIVCINYLVNSYFSEVGVYRYANMSSVGESHLHHLGKGINEGNGSHNY